MSLATGQKVQRKYFETWVNVGTSDAPEWELEGRGIEESRKSLNIDKEKVRDILGNVDVTVNGAEPEQEFSPNTFRIGHKLSKKLVDIEMRKAWSEYNGFEVMTVYKEFMSDDGKNIGTIEQNCTITPSELGGSDYFEVPFTIDYSNEIKTSGTVTYGSDGQPTITAGE